MDNYLQQFSASLKPLTTSVGKGWIQAQQFAKEKVLKDADVTELPAEYRALEEKVDKVKLIHELFLKVSKNYTYPNYDYEPEIQEKLTDFATVVSSNAMNLANKLAGGPTKQTSNPEIPPSLAHSFAKAAYHSAELVPNDDPFKSALLKFGSIQEKIGNHRLQQDHDAVLKFYKPLETKTTLKIDEAMRCRRSVMAARLTYDSIRSRAKVASPNTAPSIAAQQSDAENEFVALVEECMEKMKAVIDNGDLLKNLADLVAIQLQYHKAVFEALSELSPELDELVVANETL